MRNETATPDETGRMKMRNFRDRGSPIRNDAVRFYVYIMTDPADELLFVGVSGNLKAVMAMCRYEFEYEHGTVIMEKLVYYEIYDSVETALMRNRELHLLSHDELRRLVDATNDGWGDLFEQLDDSARADGGIP
ncbi:MAG TPA: hypothetical protein PKG59_19120 [Spirochaetota bacterium]|nr:hypothetical protein [Spirochaetota bacterium]